MIKEFLAKIAAKRLAKKLDLKEGQMEDAKKWYKSQTILGAIVAVLFNAYEGVAVGVAPHFGWNLPPCPPMIATFVNTILGAGIIHGRVTAETKIG